MFGILYLVYFIFCTWLQNLNESVDNAQLQELFQSFGTILSCKVETLEDGKSKEYGFVQFDSDDCANAAIQKLNGAIVGGKEMYAKSPLFFKF